MTVELLNRLLACFHSRIIAGHKLELLRQKLITFFESHRCHLSEEYADRTIYRVARKLDEGLEISTIRPVQVFFGRSWQYFDGILGRKEKISYFSGRPVPLE